LYNGSSNLQVLGPISPILLKELVIHIQATRVTHASRFRPSISQLDHINNKWVQRFQNQHPEVQAIYTHQLEHSRKQGASYEHVRRWFDAVGDMLQKHKYNPRNMWNMNESGFGIGKE
jgi:hypothetical protein